MPPAPPAWPRQGGGGGSGGGHRHPPPPPTPPLSNTPAATAPPIALSASQPHWGKTSASPSSLAIQAATFRLDHRPPSGGGWVKRARKRSRSPGLSTLGTPPLRAPAQVAQRIRTFRVVAGEQLLDPARHEARHRRDVRDRVPPGQQPDYLEVPHRRWIARRPEPRLQVLHAQMTSN